MADFAAEDLGAPTLIEAIAAPIPSHRWETTAPVQDVVTGLQLVAGLELVPGLELEP